VNCRRFRKTRIERNRLGRVFERAAFRGFRSYGYPEKVQIVYKIMVASFFMRHIDNGGRLHHNIQNRPREG